MQPGSLVVTEVDYTKLDYLQIIGIIPKPGIIFTCKSIFMWDGCLCIRLEECKLLYGIFNKYAIQAEFIAKAWKEVMPPDEVDIQEIIRDSVRVPSF